MAKSVGCPQPNRRGTVSARVRPTVSGRANLASAGAADAAQGGTPDLAEAEAMPKVLLVEDEFIIALEMELALLDLGCTVLGPVASAAGALALLDRERPDVAILDVNLLDGL